MSQVGRHRENEEGGRWCVLWGWGGQRERKPDRKGAAEEKAGGYRLTRPRGPGIQKAAWLGTGSGYQAFVIILVCVLGQVASSLFASLSSHIL